jgi:hypothetical protein
MTALNDEQPLPFNWALRYFAVREQGRAKRVAAVLVNGMTGRERALVREAAVMGYVRGVLAVPGGHRETIPPDAEVLAHVVLCCLSTQDLYPAMARAERRAVRKARREDT